MKLSEVTIDKNTLPTQHEIQIVQSIFDGSANTKQEPFLAQSPQTQKAKATSSGSKPRLLTTVVVGFIITFLLLIQPSLNNLFQTQVNYKSSFQRFLPIFVQVVFSMLVFYLITKMLVS